MVVRAGPLAWAALRLFPLVGPLLIISAIAIVQYDTNLNAPGVEGVDQNRPHHRIPGCSRTYIFLVLLQIVRRS